MQLIQFHYKFPWSRRLKSTFETVMDMVGGADFLTFFHLPENNVVDIKDLPRWSRLFTKQIYIRIWLGLLNKVKPAAYSQIVKRPIIDSVANYNTRVLLFFIERSSRDLLNKVH
jgi:hypothetical protein